MSRTDAALSGMPLSALDARILVTDIRYTAPDVTQCVVPFGGRDGQSVLSRRTRSCGVQVIFELHERDTVQRAALLRQVQAWAMAGGWLTTSDRAEQRLFVRCDAPPTALSALCFTQPLKIGFTAHEIPFWQDAQPTVAVFTDRTQVFAPGLAAPCLMDGRVVNTGESPIDRLCMGCGETVWRFEGLALLPKEALTFGHDEQNRLFIRAGGRSVMGCRTGDSSDELTLIPGGVRTLFAESDTRCQRAELKIRGLWP